MRFGNGSPIGRTEETPDNKIGDAIIRQNEYEV